MKRAMLAIEVHRHRSSPTLDRHGIHGWLDLAAADQPHQQNANWRSIPGLRANVGCPLGYTKLPFATTAASGRDSEGFRMPDIGPYGIVGPFRSDAYPPPIAEYHQKSAAMPIGALPASI
jgi:hypothetical protein